MNLDELKSKFPEIKKAYFENEANEIFLRIEVSHNQLEEVAKLSKSISTYLDSQTIEYANYFLDVYSSGTDHDIPSGQLDKYINRYIKVTLKDVKNTKIEYIGYLIALDPITIKWNNKGQIKKLKITKEDIKTIQTYAKAGK